MRQRLHNPQGKVALITGAAQRIGAELARRLHHLGMDLILHYRRSADAAQALQARLQAARPSSVHLLQADLNRCTGFADLMAQVHAFRGRLDVLVNNASSFFPTPIDTLSEAQWEDLLGANLKGPFFLTLQATPLLRATRGCVVNLVDIHAQRPLKDHSVYSIAKAGNAMMVKALARELAPRVRVNGIAPGAILWPEQEPGGEDQDEVLARTALERVGSPTDIADTLQFLICDADYITGQIITVDGGRSLQQ